MTLLEAIRDNDGRLYIGSCSGWFFIGSRDEAIKEMPKISKFYKKGIRKCIDYKITKLENNTDESKKKAIERYIKRKMRYLRHWTDFLDREVKMIYPKDIERGLAIVIEGEEQGGYWTYDEWRNNRKKY